MSIADVLDVDLLLDARFVRLRYTLREGRRLNVINSTNRVVLSV